MLDKILTHPSLQYADELKNICQPLNKINISYFGYALIDNEGRFSTLNNHPYFMEHYLSKQYYNADFHLAKDDYFGNYIISDSLELTNLSKKINQDAADFGIKHFFTIIEKDQLGTHYYHFANNSSDSWINQFYINNIDLLKMFIRYFNDCVRASKQISAAYNIKFAIDHDTASFSINDTPDLSGTMKNRSQFLRTLNASENKSPLMALTPQQSKCVKLLVHGLSANEIAQQLNLSRRTVENYLSAVRDNSGCRNSREIIAQYHSIFK
jgi:DNA-binding CsgD family transcriptional regulator